MQIIYEYYIGRFMTDSTEYILSEFIKGKAVPQHTYGGAGGTGCIATSHSRPRH
jgi:hypothetical protein